MSSSVVTGSQERSTFSKAFCFPQKEYTTKKNLLGILTDVRNDDDKDDYTNISLNNFNAH